MLTKIWPKINIEARNYQLNIYGPMYHASHGVTVLYHRHTLAKQCMASKVYAGIFLIENHHGVTIQVHIPIKVNVVSNDRGCPSTSVVLIESVCTPGGKSSCDITMLLRLPVHCTNTR